MIEPTSQRASRLLGSTLASRYHVTDVLSERVTGALFAAEDLATRARVAVRVLYPETARGTNARAMLAREALVGARVDHPDVAAGKTFLELPDGSLLMPLEGLEGATLRRLMDAGPLPLGRAAGIVQKVALALDALHALGVVHRALAPEAVHVAPIDADHDAVKVTDLRHAALPPSIDDGSLGALPPLPPSSPAHAYASPEVIAGKSGDASDDFHALGQIFYELVTGARPATREAALPMTSSRSIAAAVDALAQHLITAAPSQRAAVAREVVRARDALGEAASSSKRASAPSLPDAGSPHTGRRVSMLSVPDPSPMPAVVGPTRAPTGSVPARTGLDAARTTPGRAKGGRSLGPSSFRSLPTPVKAYITGTAAVVLLVGLAVTARSLTEGVGSEQPAEPRSAAASDREAQKPGSGDEKPKPGATSKADVPEPAPVPDVSAKELRARVDKDLLQGNVKAFIADVDLLLRADPELAKDRDIQKAIIKILMSAMVGDGVDGEKLFAIIEKQMGEEGPDMLFELLTTKGGSRAAKRAEELLASEEVQKRGTPALRIAYEMRVSKCDEKAALFPRAKMYGDRRTLGQLQALNAQCSPRHGQCCFPKDPALKEAMDAITSRLR